MARIGIDARFYGEAGPGRYTKAIVQHLEKVDAKNEYLIFVNDLGNELYHPKNPNFKKVVVNYPWYGVAEQTLFLIRILARRLDIYYVPHFNIPVLYPWRIVTAIPDMTMHKFSTRFSTTLPHWLFNIKKFVYRLVFWWAVFRSYKVIVPSKIVLSEFLRYVKGIKFDKYVLAYEGVDPDFFKKHGHPEEVLQKYGVGQDFILYVGSMYEHKNVPALLDMYEILRKRYGYKGQFVMVSKRDQFSREIFDVVKKRNLQDQIIMPAFMDKSLPDDRRIVITDEEITAFRMKAKAYVFAALTEGFSLTALEGMVHGLPAVLSDIDCHREVYGDSVLYFDPRNIEEMAEKVNLMLNDDNLRNEYIKKGYEQVKKYDWLKTAEITKNVFDAALGNL